MVTAVLVAAAVTTAVGLGGVGGPAEDEADRAAGGVQIPAAGSEPGDPGPADRSGTPTDRRSGPEVRSEGGPGTAAGAAPERTTAAERTSPFRGPVACVLGAGELLRGDDEGCVRWATDVRSEVTGLAVAGELLLVTAARRVIALDASDGSRRWGADAGRARWPPVVAGDRVVVATDDGALVALDRRGGRPTWRVSVHGVLAAWEADGGAPAWRTRYVRRLHGLAADATTLALVSGGTVAALSPEGGRRWLVNTSAAPTDVAVGAGLVATAGADGVVARDAGTGRVRWRRTDVAATAVAVPPSGPVVVLGPAGVHTLDPDSGTTVDRPRAPDRARRLLALPQGGAAAVTADAVTRIGGGWTLQLGRPGVAAVAAGTLAGRDLVAVGAAQSGTIVGFHPREGLPLRGRQQ